MIEHGIKLRRQSTLKFPEEIVFVEVEGDLLAISPATANWLVVGPDQREWLGKLRNGVAVGLALEEARQRGEKEAFDSLLKQILAREFAGIDAAPRLFMDDPKDGLHIYLTNACNLSWTHCYMYSGKPLKDELNSAEWMDVLTEFAALGEKTVTLSGGELTTKRGWFDVLKHAHGLDLKITLLTNGTLWEADDIEAAAPLLAEVQISIDGPTEESNALVRGAGAFGPAVRAAVAFANLGTRTSIAMTPTFDNLDSFANGVRDFAEYVLSQTTGQLFIKIGSSLIAGRHGGAPAAVDAERYWTVAKSASDDIYNDSETRNFALGHSPNHGFRNCGFGGLALAADGGAFPCNRVSEVDTEGNVRSDGLQSVLNRVLQLQQETSVDYVEPCRTCEIRYICGGGCRIEEFSFHGRVRTGQGGEGELIQLGLPSHKQERAAEQSGTPPAKRTPYRHIQCDREFKLSLYRRMVGATRYKYALDG